MTGRIYLALVHYPVRNRDGQTIASAVTNLDIHDLARAGRTFGVERIFIVTPLVDQKTLVGQIVDHWISGYGGIANPDRKEALKLVAIRDTLEEVRCEILGRHPDIPLMTVATTARQSQGTIQDEELCNWVEREGNCLLVFGTAWGLSEEALQLSDRILTPITGRGSYNHLSVRSAVSIILDRLVNPRTGSGR